MQLVYVGGKVENRLGQNRGINDKVKEALAPRLPPVEPSLAPSIEQEGMIKGAVIDPTELYRYSLWREWNRNAPRVAFVMLNPSTADSDFDDTTIRRCIYFAKSWGYGSLEVVNLFAYRATEPEDLRHVKDPVGSENDRYLLEATERAARIIVAWGKVGCQRHQDQAVLHLIADNHRLYCLGMTKDGHPRHPLYVGRNTTPVLFPVPPLQLVLPL